MDYINNLPIANLSHERPVEYEQIGEKINGFNGKILINNKNKKINEYEMYYIDIEKSDFIKAIINGKGDLWDSEFSSKGQRILGDYIIHQDYIEPNNTAKFVLFEQTLYFTIILDTPQREIITFYDSNYTENIDNLNYIEFTNNTVLISDKDIYQIYVIPAIIPEEYAELLSNEELISPPYFTLNNQKYIGNVQSPSIEAIGRGESFRFNTREME